MTTTRDATQELRHLIDGQWEEGEGDVVERRNPTRPDETVISGRAASTRDMDRAIAAARRASLGWRRTPAHERGEVLIRAGQLLTGRVDELARELTREEGKPITEARGEVARATQILRYVGSDADRESGEVFNSPRAGERILVVRRPLGVVGAVTPFNFPIAIPAWKIAPALMHGNAVVWKPASSVPLLAIRLAEALHEAGLPAGVINLVVGDGSVGAHLAASTGIDGMTFTGSTEVGRRLAVQLAGSGVPFQAELGGKNSSIVLADADLDTAVDQVTSGAFRGSGQRCTATSRLIVESAVADEFLERLAARLADTQVGDPLDATTYVGPVIDERSKARIRDAISHARSSGEREIFGREDYDEGILSEGHFIPPTVFELNASRPTHIWTTEIFGPLLAVRRASNHREALELANDSEYGLSGSIFTSNLSRALDAIDDFEVGVLHVNSESAGADPHVPFGGIKRSGLGPKEQGRASREFFTETTTVYLRG